MYVDLSEIAFFEVDQMFLAFSFFSRELRGRKRNDTDIFSFFSITILY